MENGRNEIGGRQLVAGYLGVVLMLIGGIILLPLAALPRWQPCLLFGMRFPWRGILRFPVWRLFSQDM